MQEQYHQFLQEGEQAGIHYGLAGPRYVPMGIAGTQIGNRAGSSLEFKEHREYQLGDDLRRIDWSAFARSDKLSIKLYREEISPHVDIVIDGSRSMSLPDSAKAKATLGLAAIFAMAAANCGYTHCAWLVKEACARIENSNERPSMWQGISFDYAGELPVSLARLPPRWRAQGIRVLLSDLLWLGDPLTTLAYFRENASAVIVVQVLAEADIEPPQHGNIELWDYENQQRSEIFFDTMAETRYRQALARHQEYWHRATRQVGAMMVSVSAEKLSSGWQLEELVAAEVMRYLR
jgi:uncharacterized protein (DUF58 family)